MNFARHKKYAFDSKDPSVFKRRVHVDWLVFDPDVLQAEVPVDPNGRIEAAAIEACLSQHAPDLKDVFAGWCGVHAIPGPGLVYCTDWYEFLAGLRWARQLKAEDDLEVGPDGAVSPLDGTY